MNQRHPILTVEELTARYQLRTGEDILAVDDVSFALVEGEVLGIAGESGCGKSSLAKSISGLFLPPLVHKHGSVRLHGANLLDLSPDTLRKEILGRKISTIPQSSLNSLNPTRKIGAFACDFIREHQPDIPHKKALKHTAERFASIGLPTRVLNDFPNQLSGGMRQRCVIGISTLLNPDVVIADEPSSALDVSSQKAVITLLLGLLHQKLVKSMIFITHDLPLLRHVADRIGIMYSGVFVEIGPTEDVVFHPKHPYTQALMGSLIVPEKGMREKTPTALPGAPPKLRQTPTACRFADRCPARVDACLTSPNPTRNVGNRLVRCIRAS